MCFLYYMCVCESMLLQGFDGIETLFILFSNGCLFFGQKLVKPQRGKKTNELTATLLHE